MGLSKLVDKLKSHTVSDIPPAAPAAEGAADGPLLARQLYRTRYHFGVNFGGCFVGEKWIFHNAFPDGTECELDAVRSGCNNNKDDYKAQLEKRWANYASDKDWQWLLDHGVTAVRIPIGYWHVDGGKYTSGTKFAPYADVYATAWTCFKHKFVEAAAKHHIGVLVDLHSVPGGANGDAHSGEHSGGLAGFWASSSAQSTAVAALEFMARDLKHYDNIVAIQVVNEAEFSNSARHQKSFYSKAIEAIRAEDPDVPVVILDGWWPDQWVQWVQLQQKDGSCLGVVVDHHCYRCFDDKDKQKPADKIIADLDSDLLTNLTDSGAGVDFIVGEWSCVLDGATWDKSGDRAALVRQYAEKQLHLIASRSAGLYFWTYKFEAGLGGEWDFRQMVDRGVRAPQVRVPAPEKLDDALSSNYDAHVKYWEGKGSFEHDRFKAGFSAAIADGQQYAKHGALVGRRQALKLARRAEHVRKAGKLDYLWEWDQGWDKGMEEFTRAACS